MALGFLYSEKIIIELILGDTSNLTPVSWAGLIIIQSVFTWRVVCDTAAAVGIQISPGKSIRDMISWVRDLASRGQ
jgi:hypothetical protein